MYADIDEDGKVSLHDMVPAEAELIQTAAIRLAEETNSNASTLRKVAMEIDKVLVKASKI